MTHDIDTLIFKAYHGELSDAERDALSEWVVASPLNSRRFIQFGADARGIEIALRSDRVARAGDSVDSVDDVFGLDAITIPGAPGEDPKSEQRHPMELSAGRQATAEPGDDGRRPAQWPFIVPAAAALLALAAVLGLAFWLGGLGPQPQRTNPTISGPSDPVAPIAEERLDNVETTPWVTENYDSELIHFANESGGSRNQIGDMPFGFAAYSFWKRGTVVVEGPALWQMLEGDAIRLFEGRLVARADQDALDPLIFLIDFTEIRVRGAEFGVYRTGKDTASIIVFSGSIQVSHAEAGEQSHVQTMAAGQIGILQTRLGTVVQQTPVMQGDVARFSRATVRLRYRPLQTTRSVYFLTNAPQSLYTGDQVISGKACLIRESAGVTVGTAELATLAQDSENLVAITEGQPVDSYLLHFDPLGDDESTTNGVEGTITFDRPIQVILGSSDSIRATDLRYGVSGTAYPRSPDTAGGAEGSESWGIEIDRDYFELSADRTQLFFQLDAGQSLDQVRILVEARPTP